jgi:hypothetical protein
MSALGQKPTFAVQQVMSALPLKTTEIVDIVGFRPGAKRSALPLKGSKFKRRPAPLL